MEWMPRAGYSSLPLEIRETISQYLDIKSLLALGGCDPQILKRTCIFTNQLSRTTLKKTFNREYPKQCTTATTVTVDWVANPPPFPCQTDYESALRHNQEVIKSLLKLINSMCAVMCTVKPFLKGELYSQLALFIINCYPPYKKPRYDINDVMPRYVINDESCTLCSTEQAVNISFLYKDIIYCTTLDGWNLLSYSNIQVEFKECIGFSHPLEHAYKPIIGYFEGEYRYPKVPGHELVYRSMISGSDLKRIYDNVKQNNAHPLYGSLFCKPHVKLTVETIIIFSLEGAQTLFAMIEDPRVILCFKQAIYDPRQGQTGITAPRPSPIYWGDSNFTLPRTIQDPSCLQAKTVWTIYHLDRSLTWKKTDTYTTQGFRGRPHTRFEVMILGNTPPVEPINAGDEVIRTITTQDTFIPCHMVPI